MESLPLWERGLKLTARDERDITKSVAPLVGAWIEIHPSIATSATIKSLPLWERGLKSVGLAGQDIPVCVAPLVGAWIEIFPSKSIIPTHMVAPLVGA